jgi:UTP--glucose-1-phosphate uridylyltransferase
MASRREDAMAEAFSLSDIAPPPEDAFTQIPGAGTREREEAERAGREAIDGGKVAVLVLNGGMATRYAGVVKGVDVDVLGKSFLYWKLRQARSVSASVPFMIMNSPFTHERTLEHLRTLGEAGRGAHCFVQSVYPRETLDGKTFPGSDGKPSVAGRGHGDLLECFVTSGTLARFTDLGCETLMVSNVDNLGATLDPLIVGLHGRGGAAASIEVSLRKTSHKGGIIASVRGRTQVFENIHWPAGLQLEGYRYFNTNTFYLGRAVLSSPPALRLHDVVKEVDGRKVLQREKVLGEISAFVETRFLVVPGEGRNCRFIPVKTPQELEDSRGLIEGVLDAWGLR